MNVKGIAIKVMPAFVQARFGEEGLAQWLQQLSAAAREAFSTVVLASAWYDLKIYFIEPTQALCGLFYQGQTQGAFELGMFSADVALKGIYKLFVRLAAPDYILRKAATIMSNYYTPSQLEVPVIEKGRAILRILEFSEMSPVVEQRIAGWISRALEICGAEKIVVTVTSSPAQKRGVAEFLVTWN